MRKFSLPFIALFALLLGSSCKKQETSDVTVNVSYEVDGQALEFDQLLYTNEAGNNYSVTRLLYYLSTFTLNGTGDEPYLFSDATLLESEDGAPSSFVLPDVPHDTYSSMSFLLGLPNELNYADALENTVENEGMLWPEMMGGGYHFMKMEGRYFDSTGTSTGYGMHLGRTGNFVEISLVQEVVVDGPQTIDLVMNLNEWYRDPEIFNFDVDGTFIMDNPDALQKLAKNGTDIFTIE